MSEHMTTHCKQIIYTVMSNINYCLIYIAYMCMFTD